MIIPIVMSSVISLLPMNSEYVAAHSVEAKDRKGFETSLYQGSWYSPKWRDVRKCVMKRESHYRYGVKNKKSSAMGAYQFLDNKWRDSLVWMMVAESKKTRDGLVSEAEKLRSVPIVQWNRYWQDRAFYTAWQHGKGKSHWYHHGIKCF